MASVGLFTHESCGLHDTGWGHPEHQGRLRGVMSALASALPDLHEEVVPVAGSPTDPVSLTRVHSEGHIRRVQAACAEAASSGRLIPLDGDTVVSPASWGAVLAAGGCAVDAVRAVAGGRFQAAFCAIRPPGHHAGPARAAGFCLFNHVALAARTALGESLARRVLIVDWDVHHGDGTQDIFYEDPDVYLISMHQHPLYPGTGAAHERGRGRGEGTTRNVPMPPGLQPERYVEVLLDAVDEAASFDPDIVLISAGFDSARGDPLGGFTLEADHFRELTVEVGRRTEASAERRIVSLLEGGYDPQDLGRNVTAHLQALVQLAVPQRGCAEAAR